jgi:hypothetical protein
VVKVVEMSGPIPQRWLRCPRKSAELVAGKFLALKTPLDGKFDGKVEPQFRFPPSMVFNSMKSYKVSSHHKDPQHLHVVDS